MKGKERFAGTERPAGSLQEIGEFDRVVGAGSRFPLNQQPRNRSIRSPVSRENAPRLPIIFPSAVSTPAASPNISGGRSPASREFPL